MYLFGTGARYSTFYSKSCIGVCGVCIYSVFKCPQNNDREIPRFLTTDSRKCFRSGVIANNVGMMSVVQYNSRYTVRHLEVTNVVRDSFPCRKIATERAGSLTLPSLGCVIHALNLLLPF